jgi:hypothetical protein
VFVEGQWSHRLCDCDRGRSGSKECSRCPRCRSCWWSFCCSSCQVVKLHSWLNNDQPPQFCSWPISIMLAGVVGVHLLLPIHHTYVRRELAKKFNILEHPCDTCLFAFFCSHCSAVQLTDYMMDVQDAPVRIFMDDETGSTKPLL